MAQLIQQVNFFQPIFQQEKKQFSAAVIMLYTALAVFLMLLATAYGYYQLNGLEQSTERLVQQEVNLKAQVEAAKQKLKPRQANRLLEAEKEKLNSDVRSARRLARMLSVALDATEQQYSAYFRGFAEAIMDGIWLNMIDIRNGGERMVLSGFTIRPELVPQLLQSMRSHSAFAGRSFGNVQLSREAGELNNGSIQFLLETTEVDNGDGNAN